MQKRYSTDLTDQQWEIIAPLIPPERPGGHRHRTTDLRRVVDALFYLDHNGCSAVSQRRWRDLPHDFPAWQTVYAYFALWRDDGTWQRIYEMLHRRLRRHLGREAQPGAGILDSQSVRTAEQAEEKGFGGRHGLSGRKRHLMVDTEGFALEVLVTKASMNDKRGARLLLDRVPERWPALAHVWADQGYESEALKAFARARGMVLETVRRAEGGFVVQPRRWVNRTITGPERTFAWLLRCRRLCRDFERLSRSVVSLIHLALIRLAIRRLAPAS